VFGRTGESLGTYDTADLLQQRVSREFESLIEHHDGRVEETHHFCGGGAEVVPQLGADVAAHLVTCPGRGKDIPGGYPGGVASYAGDYLGTSAFGKRLADSCFDGCGARHGFQTPNAAATAGGGGCRNGGIAGAGSL